MRFTGDMKCGSTLGDKTVCRTREMQKYNLTLLSMCEVCWNGHEVTVMQTGKTCFIQTKTKKNAMKLVKNSYSKKMLSLLEWDSV